MSLTVEKCLQAWTNSLRQMNAKADIVFFGDSLTYYGDFSSVFPDKIVCNLGLRGDTIQGMIDRVEQVGMLEPKIVYLMAGINDVTLCTKKQFKEKYAALIEKILLQLGNAKIIIQSMLPVNDKDFVVSCNNQQVSECNKIIEELAIDYNLPFKNLFLMYEVKGYLPKETTSDGLHLLTGAYCRWYNFLV